jgi:hypothetical protein
MKRLAVILRPHEWIGLGAGLVLAVAIYAALIHPSLQMVGQEEQAAASRAAAERELTQLRVEHQQLLSSIADYQRRLKELGGSPPLVSEKDAQIARVTSLAKECGVKVDQYSPIETVDQEDHQAVLLQFAGRATYEKLQAYFRRIEREVDFVDITHFSVTKLPKGDTAECQMSWSCRINGMRPDSPATQEPARKVVAGESLAQPVGGSG